MADFFVGTGPGVQNQGSSIILPFPISKLSQPTCRQEAACPTMNGSDAALSSGEKVNLQDRDGEGGLRPV